MATSILSLPNELVLEIIKYLEVEVATAPLSECARGNFKEAYANISHFALTSKHFVQYAQEALFHTAIVDVAPGTGARNETFLLTRTLASRPELANYIKRVCVSTSKKPLKTSHVHDHDDQLEAIKAMVGKLPVCDGVKNFWQKKLAAGAHTHCVLCGVLISFLRRLEQLCIEDGKTFNGREWDPTLLHTSILNNLFGMFDTPGITSIPGLNGPLNYLRIEGPRLALHDLISPHLRVLDISAIYFVSTIGPLAVAKESPIEEVRIGVDSNIYAEKRPSVLLDKLGSLGISASLKSLTFYDSCKDAFDFEQKEYKKVAQFLLRMHELFPELETLALAQRVVKDMKHIRTHEATLSRFRKLKSLTLPCDTFRTRHPPEIPLSWVLPGSLEEICFCDVHDTETLNAWLEEIVAARKDLPMLQSVCFSAVDADDSIVPSVEKLKAATDVELKVFTN
ncbi:hypothetical protein BDV96DRAFT_647429 [Lophiotrema nucula]|uniref:Uncharacterized protein n=1 Tax=Lophiotrema nucula TaxID=690887 RepID=A0A6A5Z4J0_9PLEO|nr:hypothetical protein BDV96DRAFT_647429 [Lophiotrema nucula]